jgi:2-hydroxychromene-2-carboxylate isomerase
MAADHIDFWFTMGSTYSYLSVMRLPALQQSSGIEFRRRPFHLLIILQEMKHVPFADKPAKLAYMWRDIERRAAMYRIPASLPAPYPAKNSMQANLIAILGMRQGWGVDFVKAAYRRWFQLGQETGSEPNVSESLREIGQELRSVLAQANADQTKAALTAETNAARDLGIFGSPTFSVGAELFWGDDRLEDAISWYRSGGVRYSRQAFDWLPKCYVIPELRLTPLCRGLHTLRPARTLAHKVGPGDYPRVWPRLQPAAASVRLSLLPW